jgi:hypothetical protein
MQQTVRASGASEVDRLSKSDQRPDAEPSPHMHSEHRDHEVWEA